MIDWAASGAGDSVGGSGESDSGASVTWSAGMSVGSMSGDVGVLGASGGEDSVGGEPELAGDGGDGVVVDAMELGDELGMFGDEAVEQGDVAAVVVIAQAGQGCERTVGGELVGEGAKACELFEQRVLRGG